MPNPVHVTNTSTALLSTSDGGWLVGSAAAPDVAGVDGIQRYDPEAVRISSTGTAFVSDEYGPWIDEFELSGRHLRRLRDLNL